MVGVWLTIKAQPTWPTTLPRPRPKWPNGIKPRTGWHAPDVMQAAWATWANPHVKERMARAQHHATGGCTEGCVRPKGSGVYACGVEVGVTISERMAAGARGLCGYSESTGRRILFRGHTDMATGRSGLG